MTRWFLRSGRKRVHSRTPSEEPGRSRERDRWDREPSSWPDRMPPSCGRKKRTGFGSHPGGGENPSQMRPGRKSCTAISRWSRGGCERHLDGRLKKRTGFGSHPGGKTQARCGRDLSSARTFRRHVQLLKPEDTATMQKEMAWSASP